MGNVKIDNATSSQIISIRNIYTQRHLDCNNLPILYQIIRLELLKSANRKHTINYIALNQYRSKVTPIKTYLLVQLQVLFANL